jgi:hypothetical protein
MRYFTFTKRRRVLATAIILLIAGAGCKPKPAELVVHLQLAAGTIENKHLASVLFSRNRDSIIKCAGEDYRAEKYYIFWTVLPFEGKFGDYLAVYARQKYGVRLVNCGCKSQPGAYFYNEAMGECLSKSKIKPFGPIYLEAKTGYNEELLTRYTEH